TMETTNETNEPALEWKEWGHGGWKARLKGWPRMMTVALIQPHPTHCGDGLSLLTSAFLSDSEDGLAGTVEELKRIAGEALLNFAAEFAERFLSPVPPDTSEGIAETLPEGERRRQTAVEQIRQ